MTIYIKADRQKKLKNFLRDEEALGWEYVYLFEQDSLQDNAEQVDQAFSLFMKKEGWYFHRTLIRYARLDGILHRCAIILYQSDDEETMRSYPVNPCAFSFHYMSAGHAVILKDQCFFCRKPNSKLCSGCNRTFYCTRECQVADRPRHRPVCKKPRIQEIDEEREPIEWK